MTPDAGLAAASNATFVATIVLYATAMFGYAVEYAFGRANRVAVPERELVTVGGAAESTDGPDEAGTVPNTNVSPAQAVMSGKVATIAMVLGALAHAASLALRAASVGRWPWGNMFEFIVAVSLVGVIAWIVLIARKTVARRLGLFTMLANVLLLGLATRVYTEAAPLVPALNSYWIAIHVLAAILATGIFMVGFVTAILHLIKRRYVLLTERDANISFPMTLGPRLPLAETLERITWRLHVLAFPLWTFGVIAGAIWARESWGRYWGWDPKEVWSFVAWVVYAAYLHSRATGAAGRRWAPWIVIVGWGVMLFNLFGVNLVLGGLHSYAGV
ncbi:cytochrome c-type biogenesis protein CcsB [Stackebrandtia endophytica]|uniref:Cytochrome c-type biogenesis protein CcsB n=1 Tax=Stackebrandtia endophytica TaxID=1496996 RepID=A0A543AZB8_9ACTN|nr:c-type cytochrome biogenesis protein CcsB [Stackebrandtia endophytica]TQL77924.1 cytochrome c-type biogenesis protein CcsB [Stackebrandtia endophytica]